MAHSHGNGHAIAETLRLLLVAIIRTLGILLLFIFRILALLFTKLAELLENVLKNGKHH